MKYCSHCGKEIMDEAVVCLGCGCAVTDDTATREADIAYWNKRGNAIGALVCAFLFPLLGLIFGIIGVSKCTNPEVKGKYTLSIVLSIVAWIVWAVIFSAMLY